MPAGGALMVGNHSGGLMAMDVPIIAVAFADTFGADRPLYCLAHDMLFTGVAGPVMRRFGFVPADRESAQAVLASGAVTIVFPGGDYDVFRPTLKANVIDFEGRKGYVRTALEAGVPIVPVVSIGGQEAQFHLTRGQWLGRRSPLRKVFRTDLLPLTIGFPFGLTPAGVPNIPLPTKIVTQVLDPIDPAEIAAEFGPDSDDESSPRSTRSCGRGCRTRWTSWRGSEGSRCSDEAPADGCARSSGRPVTCCEAG